MTDAELRDIGGIAASARLIRVVLGVGAAFFLVAGLLLVVAPRAFADMIGLDGATETFWVLQMLGAALIGLAGQMWLVRRAGDHPIMGAALVMVIAGGLMTVLTLTLPGTWTPVRWALLGVGVAFVVAYVALLALSRRS